MEITWEGALAARESKGKVEGKAEGKVEATCEAILLLLNRRLGPVPDDVVERLTSISDIQRLQSILEQAVSAGSIDEIDFAEPS
jgi:predicted transposase YdaD